MKPESNGHSPAFPPFHDPHTHEFGITIRDYFIAHAPAEPQPWFVPVMSGRPLDVYVDGAGNQVPAPTLTSPLATLKNRAELEAWGVEQVKQRYIQWPAAWADEMLKARKA
jgi:hypothetical protein